MQRLTYAMPHNAARLYDELVAAIPALSPVDGVARLLVSSNGNALALSVPDGFDPALLDPVLAAHDPTPTPVPPAPDYGGDVDDEATFRANAAAAVANLRAYLAVASPTAAQSTAALKLLIRVVLFMVRRMA